MRPFWPSREEFLSRPRQVSRLFVVLFIFSACLNGVLFFAYGLNLTVLARVQHSYDQSIANTLAQSARFKTERDSAQASVATKNEQLANLNNDLSDKSKQLTDLESQLASTQSKLKTQEAQLAANSTELSQLRGRPPLFSFQKTTRRDVNQDEADVRDVISHAYDTIAAVYGSPYILHQITITFVDEGSLDIAGAAAEISITNSKEGLTMEIKLPSFDKNSNESVNTIVHEIIHGFHGLAALEAPVMEEGITVAATDVVMHKLYTSGIIPKDQPYITLTSSQANQFNSTLNRPPADSSFYKLSNVGTYYSLAGWSWQQLYEADSSFFIDFNQKLDAAAVSGTRPTPSAVRDIIKQVLTTVNGQSTADYLSSQVTLNPTSS